MRLSLITKVTLRCGTIRQGRTKVSRMLMWLPMKTHGEESFRTTSRPWNSNRPPTDSSARTVVTLLSIQRWLS